MIFIFFKLFADNTKMGTKTLKKRSRQEPLQKMAGITCWLRGPQVGQPCNTSYDYALQYFTTLMKIALISRIKLKVVMFGRCNGQNQWESD